MSPACVHCSAKCSDLWGGCRAGSLEVWHEACILLASCSFTCAHRDTSNMLLHHMMVSVLGRTVEPAACVLTSRSLTPSLDRSCFSLRPRCPIRLLLLRVGPSPTMPAAALQQKQCAAGVQVKAVPADLSAHNARTQCDKKTMLHPFGTTQYQHSW
jgi:hypothetical protein